MILILLIAAALILALQVALTLTLKRLLDLLIATRDQVDAVQRRVHSLEQERDARVPPPSALFTLASRAESVPPPKASPESTPTPEPALAAASEPSTPQNDPINVPVLHEPAPMPSAESLSERVRELARRGLPVRDIAERCGLSEAETELMIRLCQEPI